VIAHVELSNLQEDLELKVVDELLAQPSAIKCSTESCSSINRGTGNERLAVQIPRQSSVCLMVESANPASISQYRLRVTTEEPVKTNAMPQIR
jgi:hypothetical protein